MLALIILGFITSVAGPRAAQLNGLTIGIALVFVTAHGLYVYFALRDVQGSRAEPPRSERKA